MAHFPPPFTSSAGVTNSISRREFGRAIGTVAVGGTLSSESGAPVHARAHTLVSSQASPKSMDDVTLLSAIELARADPHQTDLRSRGNGCAPGAHRARQS